MHTCLALFAASRLVCTALDSNPKLAVIPHGMPPMQYEKSMQDRPRPPWGHKLLLPLHLRLACHSNVHAPTVLRSLEENEAVAHAIPPSLFAAKDAVLDWHIACVVCIVFVEGLSAIGI